MYVSLQSSCINYCLLFSILCFRSRCVSFSAAICVLPSVRLSVCPTLLPWLLRFSCFYAALVDVVVVVVIIIIIFMLYTWLVCLHFVVSSNQTQVIYMYLFHMRATNEEEQQTKNKRINKRRCKTHTQTHTHTHARPETTRNGLQCNKDWQQQAAMAIR